MGFHLLSCTSTPPCKSSNRFIKKVDTNGRFKVESTHCVKSEIIDLELRGWARIQLEIYDRVTGKKIERGFITINGKYQSDYEDGYYQLEMKPDVVDVGVMSDLKWSIYLGFSLELEESKSYLIRCYVGGSAQ